MKRLLHFRLVPQLDRIPRLIGFVQTPAGKICIAAASGFCLYAMRLSWWLDVAVVLTVLSFLPQFRKYILTLSTIYWLFSGYTGLKWDSVKKLAAGYGFEGFAESAAAGWYVGVLAAVVLFCMGYSYLAHLCRNRWFMRRPLFNLMLFYFLLLFILLFAPLSNLQKLLLWAFVLALGRYFWYLAYSLVESRSAKPKPFTFQFGHYFAFWASGVFDQAPVAKGAAYLRRIEVKSSEELAVVQLKGLKLLLWGLLIAVFGTIYVDFIHGMPRQFVDFVHCPYSLKIPTYWAALYSAARGEPYPVAVAWAALCFTAFGRILMLCFYGHMIVGICRLAGFNALRNTYKPLYATTLVDYWNRIYFYFKELLVDFFFYPTFLRCFKKQPKLRLFTAVFAAAGLGNLLFHFLGNIERLLEFGLRPALSTFQTYVVYSVIFGTAIGISAVRKKYGKSRAEQHWFQREVLSRITVFGFIILIQVFDLWHKEVRVEHCFAYLLGLFGISG